MHPTARFAGRKALLGLAVAAALWVAVSNARPADARSERSVSHPFERIWPTAVRHLRIGEGLTIVERDQEVGYILFDLEEDRRRFRGSLELIRTEDQDGRAAVRMILHIEGRPNYVELGILDRLLARIRDEHGDPPRAPRAPPPERPKPTKPQEEE
jgi:hypothetical protein